MKQNREFGNRENKKIVNLKAVKIKKNREFENRENGKKWNLEKS